MLENPDNFDERIRRSPASAMMTILYDYPTLENEHDKALKGMQAFVDRVSAAAAPGARLVETFPWMNYIPERYEPMSFIVASLGTMEHQIFKVET
jgi:hypothetical protein